MPRTEQQAVLEKMHTVSRKTRREEGKQPCSIKVGSEVSFLLGSERFCVAGCAVHAINKMELWPCLHSICMRKSDKNEKIKKIKKTVNVFVYTYEHFVV